MSREPMRAAACEAAVERFLADERTAVVLAEISTDLFEPAFRHDPRRAINVGIMEQTMVGVAAGFALEGFRPIVHTITPFLAERALEQVKLDFGYQQLEGTFITTGASYDYAASGMTHHGWADAAALSTVPGLEILVPGAAAEAAALVRSSHGNGRATYVRTSAAENATARELAPGGLTPVCTGSALTVIAVGPLLDRTRDAVAGLDARVLYATTLRPLDAATLAAQAAPAAEVVIVEPFAEGTLVAQVAAALADRPIRLLSIGVPRQVISRYGTPEQHDRALGLDAAGIRERVLRFLERSDAGEQQHAQHHAELRRDQPESRTHRSRA
jgi:transketolase